VNPLQDRGFTYLGRRNFGLAFHILERYAEAELDGTGPGSRFPGVAAHLRRCEACHQDYQGLLAAVEGLRARRVCEVANAPTPAACDGSGLAPARTAERR
jgi:hypothetical protein